MFQKSSHIEIEFLKKDISFIFTTLIFEFSEIYFGDSMMLVTIFYKGDGIQMRHQHCFLSSPTSVSPDSSSDYQNTSFVEMKLLFTKNEANISSENRKSFQSCKRSFIRYSFGFKLLKFSSFLIS